MVVIACYHGSDGGHSVDYFGSELWRSQRRPALGAITGLSVPRAFPAAVGFPCRSHAMAWVLLASCVPAEFLSISGGTLNIPTWIQELRYEFGVIPV